MKYRLYERAFHPDKNFGIGGLFFDGDGRGFSTKRENEGVTARVWAYVDIDTSARNISSPVVASDPSKSPWGIAESYQTPDRKPRGALLSKSISPESSDGMQNVALIMHTWGKNHSFRITQDGPSLNWIIPDLDVTTYFMMRIDLHKNEIHIESTIRGDGFPNSEVFICDEGDTRIMLNTHHRIGQAVAQLGGNHNHLLSSTEIVVGCDGLGNFTGPIQAVRSVDFMPYDRDLIEEAGTTTFSITAWNRLHTSRKATESSFIGLDTDDRLPSHMYPRDGNWAVDDVFREPSVDDLPTWDH